MYHLGELNWWIYFNYLVILKFFANLHGLRCAYDLILDGNLKIPMTSNRIKYLMQIQVIFNTFSIERGIYI